MAIRLALASGALFMMALLGYSFLWVGNALTQIIMGMPQ